MARYTPAEMDQNTDHLLRKLSAIGPARVSLHAQMVKLADEVDECRELINPVQEEHLLDELADVVIVCHTATRVLGRSSAELLERVIEKSRTNAARTWYPTASGTARHTPEDPAPEAPRPRHLWYLAGWAGLTFAGGFAHPVLGMVVGMAGLAYLAIAERFA